MPSGKLLYSGLIRGGRVTLTWCRHFGMCYLDKVGSTKHIAVKWQCPVQGSRRLGSIGLSALQEASAVVPHHFVSCPRQNCWSVRTSFRRLRLCLGQAHRSSGGLSPMVSFELWLLLSLASPLQNQMWRELSVELRAGAVVLADSPFAQSLLGFHSFLGLLQWPKSLVF